MKRISTRHGLELCLVMIIVTYILITTILQDGERKEQQVEYTTDATSIVDRESENHEQPVDPFLELDMIPDMEPISVGPDEMFQGEHFLIIAKIVDRKSGQIRDDRGSDWQITVGDRSLLQKGTVLLGNFSDGQFTATSIWENYEKKPLSERVAFTLLK